MWNFAKQIKVCSQTFVLDHNSLRVRIKKRRELNQRERQGCCFHVSRSFSRGGSLFSSDSKGKKGLGQTTKSEEEIVSYSLCISSLVI